MNVVQIERYDALRDRLRSWSGTTLSKPEAERVREALPSEGKRFRFVLRTVVSVIAVLSGGMLFGFLNLVGFPLEELLAGLACVTISELARRNGWRHTGAEEGWMAVGCVLVVLSLPDSWWQSETGWILIAAAVAVAAWRVRSPLMFGIVALLLVGWMDEMLSELWIILVTLAGALVAALVRSRRRGSPFVETSLTWVQIASILAATVYALDEPAAKIPVGIALVAGLVIALRWRDAVTFWTMVPLAILASYEIGRHFPLPQEWKLMLGGGAVIAATLTLDRWLRRPVRGWTSRKTEAGDGELLELIGTISITPARSPAVAEEAGGEFGGAGATAEWKMKNEK